MSCCGGGSSLWDSEVGETNFRSQSRKRWKEREKEEMEALAGRNEDEAFRVADSFRCAEYDPARLVLLYHILMIKI